MCQVRTASVVSALVIGIMAFSSHGALGQACQSDKLAENHDRAGRPLWVAYGGANMAAPDKRKEFFADCAGAGINTIIVDTRLISPLLTTMKRNDSGQLEIVEWKASNLVKRPLVGREKYIEFANDAAAAGLDVLFTHQLKWNEWDVLTEVLGVDYAKTFNGPTRYGFTGEIPTPAPLAKGFWLDINLCAASFYAGVSQVCPNVRGFLFDFETYGTKHGTTGFKGTALARNNGSFDDLTFAAVTDRMKQRGQLPADHACPNKARRYDDLKARGQLKTYFATQGELVIELIAAPFRRAIDQINPDFLLGFYPYHYTEYYDAWARGWATDRAPVLLVSESEYYGMCAPSTLREIEKLRELGINFRYLAGSMAHAGSLTPEALERNIRRERHHVGDYWMFGAYCFTMQKDKPNPEGKGWWLVKPGREFWAAVGRANSAKGSLPQAEMYLPDRAAPPGSLLLTGNRHYDGLKADLDVKVAYTPAPDVTYAEDSDGDCLFDGGESNDPWLAGWEVKKGQTYQAVVDLGRVCTLAKIYVKAGHLTMFPIPEGLFTVSVSSDGEEYELLGQRTTKRGKFRDRLVWENLNLRGRFIKVSFLAKDVPGRDGVGISEVAVWGQL